MKNKFIGVIISIFLIVTPLVLLYFLLKNDNVVFQPYLHFSLVLISSVFAIVIGIFAYLEHKVNNNVKMYLISLGFFGVGIIYGFHAFITPQLDFITFFTFPDTRIHISAFVLYGDLSRLWLGILLILPTRLFSGLRVKYMNKKTIGILVLFLFLLSLILLKNPTYIPYLKNVDGTDTTIAVLIKSATLVFFGLNAIIYYNSYTVKPSFSGLSIIITTVLIIETTISFMISIPWGYTWWLAHYLFLLSYFVSGIGILISYYGNEQYVFFNVAGELRNLISDLENKNKLLNQIANHDPLTGLINRNKFMVDVSDIIERNEVANYAFLFIDLDGFKAVNDMFGHKSGDEALEIVSNRLRSSLKFNDILSRFGGDEFVVFLNDIEKQDINQLSERIIKKINENMIIDGNIVQIGASIGATYTNNKSYSIQSLITMSDSAMYKAKNKGKNNVVLVNA